MSEIVDHFGQFGTMRACFRTPRTPWLRACSCPPTPEKLPLCRCQNFLKHKETKSKLMLKLLLKIWCGDRLKFKLGNISELIDSWVNKHLSFVVFVIGNNSTWNCYPYSLSTPWLYTRWTNADSSHTLRTPLWQSQLESNYCSTLLIKSSSKNTLNLFYDRDKTFCSVSHVPQPDVFGRNTEFLHNYQLD